MKYKYNIGDKVYYGISNSFIYGIVKERKIKRNPKYDMFNIEYKVEFSHYNNIGIWFNEDLLLPNKPVKKKLGVIEIVTTRFKKLKRKR